MIKSRETHDPLSGEEDGDPLPADSVNLGSGTEKVPSKERGRSDLLKILGGSKLQYLSGGGDMWSLWNLLDPCVRRARTDAEILACQFPLGFCNRRGRKSPSKDLGGSMPLYQDKGGESCRENI